MTRVAFGKAVAFLLLLGPSAIVWGKKQDQIYLANKTWKIDIDPSTLEMTATVAGARRTLTLSGPQPQSLRVDKRQQSSGQANWQLPDKRLAVSAKLENDTLEVGFTSQTAGKFTWPILPPLATNRAYILPIGEGVYAPAHDPSWSNYLENLGGLSTTENLYLPLWGVDGGSQILTYIATNQFNNALTFQNVAGSLAAQFTHQFTPNWKVKTCGLRISLDACSPIEPAKRYRRWLIDTGQFVSMREKIRRNPNAAKLLGAAHVYLWGDGLSLKMLDALHAAGFDRLWLGSPGWKELRDNPQAVQEAKAMGYLIGPYDSYDSVHPPDAKPDDTWETAQFDQTLYDNGAIVLRNGKKKSGFLQKGYYLSESAVEPYMKARVARLTKEFKCNSWFIDCDAAGEFYEDYSPIHPANQEQEMRARLKRMAWIRDTYTLVIGSEGGSAYSSATVHFAHGVMTTVFGWDDPDLKSRNSPYFLGAYYPADGPTLFLKQVPLKPFYYRFLIDPRFRLPLYETVFHDSVVATHHWSSPTLKFSNQVVERSLLEQLYNVPPLFHLNSHEFARHRAWMEAEYAFFSPLHRKLALLPLTAFAWLTPDHQVQRTVFDGSVEIIANFRSNPFNYLGHAIPPKSLLALDHSTHQVTAFKPGNGD
jgi:hypothetical protein